MNTRLSGSARVDRTDVLPSGKLRGLTKLIKITEDVRKYAAEHGMLDQEGLAKGMAEKAATFRASGAELYVADK